MLLLFVGSGCAALIYEVVWFQLLQLVIGLTAASLGVLLATFMGGMCVGSIALARVIRRQVHPLKVYAALEFGICILGITVLFAVPFLAGIYSAHVGHGTAGIILRAVVAGICLVPPTLLMGATLPGDFTVCGVHAGRRFVAGILLRRQYRRGGGWLSARRVLSAPRSRYGRRHLRCRRHKFRGRHPGIDSCVRGVPW